MSNYILRMTFTEPCDGSESWVVALADDEVQKIEEAIAWLEEHAGQEWGHCLASWELAPSRAAGGDLVGLDAVLDVMILNSRYAETEEAWGESPGEFYGASLPLFDDYRNRQRAT